MPRQFHDRFNIEVGADEARRRFINRALNDILNRYFGIEGFFGLSIDVMQRRKLETDVVSSLGERYAAGAAFTYAAKSFTSCLLALESIHSHLSPWPHEQSFVNDQIGHLISESETDLGVSWDGHAFMPSGAQELDEALINQPLRWLADEQYKSVRSPFEKALQHYLESLQQPNKLADVITDSHEALEAMAKIVTGRHNKDLSANSELFISKLSISESYKRLLKDYISYAQQFRHAAAQTSPRQSPDRNETESFLYMTGIFLRLAIEAFENGGAG